MKQLCSIFIGLFFISILSGCFRSAHSTNIFGVNSTIAECYSSLYYNDDGDDLLGIEILILKSKYGPYILYQESEGGPTALFLQPAKINDNDIEIIFPIDAPRIDQFKGTITPHAISGKFSNSYDGEILLKRKESYWIDSVLSLHRTGFYSNMTYNEETRSLVGYGFFIMLSWYGYHGLYLHSSGEPNIPLLLPVKIDGTSISFTVPPNDGPHGEFKGTITKEGLTGEFSPSGEKLELKRQIHTNSENR